MRHPIRATAFAILAAAPAALAGAPGPEAAGGRAPPVFRGAEASAAAGDPQQGSDVGAVPVMRGAGPAPAAAPGGSARAGEMAAAGQGWLTVAGEKLWLVDVQRELVVACRERDALRVGRRVIECTADDLPGLDP